MNYITNSANYVMLFKINGVTFIYFILDIF